MVSDSGQDVWEDNVSVYVPVNYRQTVTSGALLPCLGKI